MAGCASVFSPGQGVASVTGQGTEELEHVQVFAQEEEKMKRQKLARLHTLATALNYPLPPRP